MIAATYGSRLVQSSISTSADDASRAMTLKDLADLLRDYAASIIPLSTVHARLLPILIADPLDVSASDPARWDAAPDEERLFWRLVYLLEVETDDDAALRGFAGRVVESLTRTRSAAATHELLPILEDQERFCAIVGKYRGRVISRTSFLSMVAESRYPSHMKLWLAHASVDALTRLCERLDAGRYDLVVAAFEVSPG